MLCSWWPCSRQGHGRVVVAESAGEAWLRRTRACTTRSPSEIRCLWRTGARYLAQCARSPRTGRPELVIYVENAGDFVVSLEAVEAVHAQKVIVNCGKLEPRLREAIGHAHDAEAPGA